MCAGVKKMTNKICYTKTTQHKKGSANQSKHDERIKALVRFVARCAAADDYHDLHNLIEDNLKNERE